MNRIDDLARPRLPRLVPSTTGSGFKAASLNYHDVAVANRSYPRTDFSMVPVADGAGEVVAIGQEVRWLSVGDRVAIHPKPLGLAGAGETATSHPIRGVSLPGILQGLLLVDANTVVRVPDHLSWTEAAALPILSTTAHNGLRSIAAGPGDTVLLLGTGGVSLTALRLAKARGTGVIITSSSDEKLEKALRMGADEAINYHSDERWDQTARHLTDGAGVDLVIDTGGADTIARSVAATRYGGTVYAIGFLGGAVASWELLPIISNALRILGNNTGSVADFSEAATMLAEHQLPIEIAATFDLLTARDAYRAQAAGAAAGALGKIVIELDR
jgi:NADPH:quinone reductase-like Zn-dependent oxidoreductase